MAPSPLPTLRHVSVDGQRIAYRRAGDGPPLVLLHGGLSDSREWSRQLAGLADAYDVVAWDAPGTGGSFDPPDWFRLPDYADVLAGLIEHLGLEAPHVGGLSFGGGLAIELAGRHPVVVRSLVLISAYAGWGGSLPPEQVRARLASALRDAGRPATEWVDGFLPGLLTPAAPPALTRELREIIVASRPAGIRVGALSFAEADLREVLPRITVPTLLIYGELDQRAPADVAEAIHRRIIGSRLVVLSGIGHQANLEAASLVNAEMRAFLRSVDAGTQPTPGVA